MANAEVAYLLERVADARSRLGARGDRRLPWTDEDIEEVVLEAAEFLRRALDVPELERQLVTRTLGDEVMATTKTKRRYAIDLPEEAMQVLRWHVETQLDTPEMQESDLLFPSVTGKFRAATVLNKPFADVAEMIGLGKRFTQRGLRRTFQDLARAAQVEGIVTRSISGHATERMQKHYSTVDGAEKRTALAKVIHLATHRDGRSGEHGGEHAPGGGEQKEKAG
mgnify:CR=1 FL=1